MLGDAERAALRGVAHLLPERLRQVIEIAAAEVPAAPDARVPAPSDDAAARLAQIDHIVVLMLENRSFDHMLGYLSLPAEQGGRGRADVDGLRGPDKDFNMHAGQRYPIHHLDRTQFDGEAEDPDHSGESVDEQLANGGQGFVENFARISADRAAKLGVAVPDPGLVIGYYNADDLPVYDHLAAEYCVVDRWFSSVPGATWPNRLYAVAGQAAGTRDDASPPIYALPTFIRYLDECNIDWRWYSYDPGTLRAADPQYRLSHHDRFGYLDQRKLSVREEEIGRLVEKGSFLDDVAAGDLPPVSWIDPHFKDLRVLGPDSNDDHPPSDVIAGQDLVLTVYHALSANAATWAKTLLIITYDEHGGFYDHVPPPPATDDHPDFRRHGVRVPALLVSPLVKPGSTSTSLLGTDFHFDHTSIMKTIFTRFCQSDGQIPALTARAAASNHLGHLLTGGAPRTDVPDHSSASLAMTEWRATWAEARFSDPTAKANPPRVLTEFQNGFYETARLLREAGLPGGHPLMDTSNLARLNESAFERRGDYDALMFDGEWLRSRTLFERSQRVAGGIADLGVRPGERVVVCMANCPEVPIVYQALWRAGAVLTPATFLLSAPDLRHVIDDSQASAVITTPDLIDKVGEAVAGLDAVRQVISTGAAEDGVIGLSSLEEADPAPIAPRSDDDLAALLYTGGTTGRAKGVMLTHANLCFTGRAVQDASHVAGVSRSLMALPLSHSYGMLVTISGMHSPERPVTVLLRWFDPRGFLELIQEHRLQTSAVVPSMIHLLLAQPLEDFDLSCLQYIGCGAAPLAPQVAQEIERRIPSMTVRQGYGLTETAALIATNPAGREKPGSVGLPIAGAVVRVVDGEDRELPAGEAGEICVRSPAVMRGYWRAGGRDPKLTAEAIRDGWLQPGDIGYLDDEGYLFIVDRKKDLIIRGGFNVYPRDVEDTLLEHPAVMGAGVVGRPDEGHGEEVVAFVALREADAVSTEELIEWSRRRIGGYKYPREVHFVDAMPLTAAGKLDRKALRGSLL